MATRRRPLILISDPNEPQRSPAFSRRLVNGATRAVADVSTRDRLPPVTPFRQGSSCRVCRSDLAVNPFTRRLSESPVCRQAAARPPRQFPSGCCRCRSRSVGLCYKFALRWSWPGGPIVSSSCRASVLRKIVGIFSVFIIVIALSASSRPLAAQQASGIPPWLRAHVGEGEGRIAPVVLQRARKLYLQKRSEGAVKNPCYFAMDATRPNDLNDGTVGRRFYVICEADRSFRAISAGHGGGRDLKGVADFANERRCAKNFGTAIDSRLTAGGAYVTGETTTSFKGYYRVSAKEHAPLLRSFVQFDGEGETADARERKIGGHAAVLLRGVCRLKDPRSRYADPDGYVPLGRLLDYAGGRSDGCTSWSPAEASEIVAMVKDDPTTLYIYPDAADIKAAAQAVADGRSLSRTGLYWNASCLREIGSPKFWPKETLDPILAQYAKDHPAPPPRPLPLCQEE
jgi:hypothetical protein